MVQIKGQIKTQEKELNKMETSKHLDAELKTLVIKMLNKLMEEQMNSELQEHKKSMRKP